MDCCSNINLLQCFIVSCLSVLVFLFVLVFDLFQSFSFNYTVPVLWVCKKYFIIYIFICQHPSHPPRMGQVPKYQCWLQVQDTGLFHFVLDNSALQYNFSCSTFILDSFQYGATKHAVFFLFSSSADPISSAITINEETLEMFEKTIKPLLQCYCSIKIIKQLKIKEYNNAWMTDFPYHRHKLKMMSTLQSLVSQCVLHFSDIVVPGLIFVVKIKKKLKRKKYDLSYGGGGNGGGNLAHYSAYVMFTTGRLKVGTRFDFCCQYCNCTNSLNCQQSGKGEKYLAFPAFLRQS